MIKFYYLNHVSTATLAPSNENSLFPVENIQDTRTTKVYRSTTTPDEIILDFATAKAVDSIFILPNKRNGFLWTPPIEINANSSSSWGSPPFTTTIESSDVDTEFNIAFKSIAPTTYRYWQIAMTGSSFVELGKVFLGEEQLIGTGRGIDLGWEYVNEDLSQSVYNRYGQKFTDVIGDRKKINATMKFLSKTDVDDFFLIYDKCKTITPFFARLLDNSMSTNMNRYSGFFFFESMPTIANEIYGRYNVSFTLVEAT